MCLIVNMSRKYLLFLLFSLQYLSWRVNSSFGFVLNPNIKNISKRDVLQKIDKVSYSFNGFQKVSTVPVLFPLDICLMDIKGITYAVTLHINKNGIRHFEVYKNINNVYEIIAGMPVPLAIHLDCQSFADRGYAALTYKMTAVHNNTIISSSPLYEIYDNTVQIVQLFSTPNLRSMNLIKAENIFYMLHVLKNTATSAFVQCPYYIWRDNSFQALRGVPCKNALYLEPFVINGEIYIAVANYADQHGRTDTDSEIYKFNKEIQEFRLFQRIRTKGAVHIKYFRIPFNDNEMNYFLIFGNSVPSKEIYRHGSNSPDADELEKLEADSIIYNFENDVFVPYQKLLFYQVNQFLPIESSVAEKFLLLVACNNQDIKIFHLKDWSFEQSDIQFTTGAFGKGVSHMRVFNNKENTYLVVANRFMLPTEANIFLPIFKLDEEANQLRLEIMQWSEANIQRLMSTDVEKLKTDVERKLTQYPESRKYLQITDIPQAHVANVTTNSLIYPPLEIGSGYWRALALAKQALDILEENLQRNPTERAKRSTYYENDQSSKCQNQFECLHVKTLIVKDKLKANKINGFDVERKKFESIKANKIIIAGKYDSSKEDLEFNYFPGLNTTKEIQAKFQESINVTNLYINGKINGYTWDELINNTLKRQATVQFLKAPVRIKNLATETITVTNNLINDRNLAKLISIDNNNGSYVVNQEVEFIKPIAAKNVIINERLNNIHINNRKLDVLLSNSNETQTIKGAKKCDNIKLLEPIQFMGKPAGNKQRRLATNTPIRIINDSLTLNGDYIIDGNIKISKLLTADDIVIANSNKSTKVLLSNGVRIDEPIELDLHFKRPIVANDSTISFINAYELQRLIKTNYTDIQIIDGKKTFNGKLEIKGGFSEVKILNNFNLEDLEKHLFLSNSNQTITVPMHFGRIMLNSLNATELKMNSIPLEDYLTKSGAQRIWGTLKVNDLVVNTLLTKNLHTSGKIFGKQQVEIYEQKTKNTPHPNLFKEGRKYRGTIYVRNLKTNSTINGRFVDQLERQLRQLTNDITYVGDLKFNRDIRLTNLSFFGTFNGIRAEEFGSCWLQKYGEQTFTEPQTISSVNCEKGINLFGKLNGYRMQDFITDTYWINRNEYIPSVIFENPIKLQGALYSDTVNKLLIPQDILFRNSMYQQTLSQPLAVEGNLSVSGRIYNTTLYNGLNLLQLNDYINGYGWDTLYVENARFAFRPKYKTLNYYNLQELLNIVWMANEDVDLQQHVEISTANFDGLLEFEGPINNVNLKYLKENYFSLTRAQTISAEILIANKTTFVDNFYANKMKLFGKIIDSKSQYRFSFENFVMKTLKKAGPQTITQHWYLPEANIQGDLHNVLINKLDLITDVVRFDIPLNEITAPKTITAANISTLHVTPESLVNNVYVANWIQETVFVYENYTIYGNTVLDSVNIYNDINVEGTVNNLIFDENTLLLVDHEQVLHGPVIIRNKFPAAQRILTNNIENLQTAIINGWSVEEFYRNQIKFNHTVNIQGSLVFTKPLMVTEYRTGEDLEREKRNINVATAYDTNIEGFADQNYILDDFEIRQVININATKMFALPVRMNGDLLDVIGIVLENSKERLYHFYNWNTSAQQYLFDLNLSTLLNEPIEVLDLAVKKDKYIWLIDHKEKMGINQTHKVIANDMESLKAIHQISLDNKWQIERFQMGNNEDCFALYCYESNRTFLYCLEKSKITKKTEIIKPRIKQILALNADMIAILSDEYVDIWNASLTKRPKQRLAVYKAKQITACSKNNYFYLAVIAKAGKNSLQNGMVEIYRSTNNSFNYMQTIYSDYPTQIQFALIPESGDILFYILSEAFGRSFTVYQYKGVSGFVQIVSKSILTQTVYMQNLHLGSGNHLVALLSKNKVTFIEVMLKKIV